MLTIETPEHLAFRVQIAGPGQRLLAWLIDLFARGVLLALFSTVVGLLFQSVSLEGVGTGLFLVALFAADWGYFVACELLTGGRSVGKIALRMRVVRANGLPITWRESVLRNLLRAADLLILPPAFALPLGPLVMALDSKFRRTGDLVAGTIVVVEKTTQVATAIAIKADPRLIEALPGAVPLSRDDLEALELFVHRQHMSDARREELAEKLAPELARRLGRPAPKNATAFLAALWVRAQDPRRGIA